MSLVEEEGASASHKENPAPRQELESSCDASTIASNSLPPIPAEIVTKGKRPPPRFPTGENIHPAITQLIGRQMNISRALSEQEEMSFQMIQALIRVSETARRYELELSDLKSEKEQQKAQKHQETKSQAINDEGIPSVNDVLQQQNSVIQALEDKVKTLTSTVEEKESMLRERDSLIESMAQKLSALSSSSSATNKLSISTINENEVSPSTELGTSKEENPTYPPEHFSITRRVGDDEASESGVSHLSFLSVPSPLRIRKTPMVIETRNEPRQLLHPSRQSTSPTHQSQQPSPTTTQVSNVHSLSPAAARGVSTPTTACSTVASKTPYSASHALKQRKLAREKRLKEIMNRIRGSSSTNQNVGIGTGPENAAASNMTHPSSTIPPIPVFYNSKDSSVLTAATTASSQESSGLHKHLHDLNKL